jgi:hypothetical protein
MQSQDILRARFFRMLFCIFQISGLRPFSRFMQKEKKIDILTLLRGGEATTESVFF